MKDKTNIYTILLIIITILSSILHFADTRTDSEGYIQLAYFIQGEDAQLLYQWASRPLVPLIASVFNQIFEIKAAFALVNVVFLILTSITLFKLFDYLLENKKHAFFAALLYPLSFPVILLGSQVLLEAATNFFYVLTILFIEKYLKEINYKKLFILFILLSLSLLTKESLFILFIYLIITLFTRRKAIKTKFIKTKTITSILLSTLPLLLWKYIIKVSSHPLISRIIYGYKNLFTIKYFTSFLIRSFLAFHILWLPAIYGLLKDKNNKRRLFYWKLFLSVFPLMILAYIISAQNINYDLRHTFNFFLIFFPATIYTFSLLEKKSIKLANTLIILFIIIYAAISFIGAYLVPETPIRNSLMELKLISSFFTFF